MPQIKKYYKMYRVLPDPSYVYLENIGTSSQFIAIMVTGTPASTGLEYSTDKLTWTNVTSTTNFMVPVNGKVYFRNSTGLLNKSFTAYYRLNMNSYDFRAGGDIRTLFNYTDVDSVTEIPQNGLCYLFDGDSNLKDISNLDFSGIERINTNGVKDMFRGCTSITDGVDLSSVISGDINTLYENCSNLNAVYTPNVTTWNTLTATNWLKGVSASGTIYAPTGSDIANYSGADGVPSGWTVVYY